MVGALMALVVLFLLGFQVLQAINDRKHRGGAQGVVLDQDGHPLSEAEVTFRSWNWRMYVPIPFTPMRVVEKTLKSTTDKEGKFSMTGPYPKMEFVSVSKAGYRQDGAETDYMWHPYGSAKSDPREFHLVSEALMQPSQIKNVEFTSVPFSKNGCIGLNLADGTVSDTPDADVLFHWSHLAATSAHGNFGKFTILAPRGGVWFWEEDRLFAPQEGYEQGVTFFFGVNFFGEQSYPFNTYPFRLRAEFYVKSENGKIYARVYIELNTADHTVSLRARVNTTGNRFVDSKGGAYALGVYPSMSPNYLNPGVPWWIPMGPVRSQVKMPDDRLREMSTNLTAYFAGHYQTPTDILEWLASSNLIRDHNHIPQCLARNYSTPTNVLTGLIKSDPNGNQWYGKNARSVLATPEDIKSFLKDSAN
jgi:hypothetical protein